MEPETDTQYGLYRKTLVEAAIVTIIALLLNTRLGTVINHFGVPGNVSPLLYHAICLNNILIGFVIWRFIQWTQGKIFGTCRKFLTGLSWLLISLFFSLGFSRVYNILILDILQKYISFNKLPNIVPLVMWSAWLLLAGSLAFHGLRLISHDREGWRPLLTYKGGIRAGHWTTKLFDMIEKVRKLIKGGDDSFEKVCPRCSTINSHNATRCAGCNSDLAPEAPPSTEDRP